MTYTVGKAAKELGVSPDTVKRHAKAGRLQGFLTPGGHHRFDATEIERFRSDGPFEEREACPHKRWCRCLVVAFDGDLDRVQHFLMDSKLTVPDLMAVKLEVLQAMSEEARKRVESGGPWLLKIKDDAAWLEQAEIKFIVDAMAGSDCSPGRLAAVRGPNGYDLPDWRWLLRTGAFEERIALETLLIAGRLTRGQAEDKFRQYWKSSLFDKDVDAFIRAAYDLQGPSGSGLE